MKKKITLLILLASISPILVIAQKKQTQSEVLKQKTLGENGFPRSVVFKNSAKIKATDPTMLFQKYVQISKGDEMVLKSSKTDKLGFEHKKYQQYHKGIKVEFATYTVHAKNGSVQSMMGEYHNVKKVKSSPSLSSKLALKRATNHVGAKSYAWQAKGQSKALEYKKPKGELVIMPQIDGISKHARLAYKFDIYSHDPLYRADVYVDASSGEIIFENAKIHHADTPASGNSLYNGVVSFTADSNGGSYRLRQTTDGNGIQTFDLNNGTNYNNASDITSNSTSFNASTGVQAHWGAEQTHKYYLQELGRNSYDDNGGIIRSYVSYSSNYVNAFWDGTRMTYGDGDGVDYGPLVSLDIVAHEISHGITEYSASLVYQRESGALNESFSDIFGESIEHFSTGTNDWQMGTDMGIGGSGAIRSMDNPNIYNDPDTYGGTNWYNPNCGTPTRNNDFCGVHINSGVQNKWFYILTAGEAGTNDVGDSYSVTGIGIAKSARIAYRNLSVYLSSNSTFADARTGSIQSAIDLYGSGSAEEIATTNAWYAVGVGAEYVEVCSLTAPSGVAASNIGDNGFTVNWNSVSGAASYTVTVGGNSTVVSGTSYSASGLTEGTQYGVSVTANCSTGGSGASSSINVTTTGTAAVTYCDSQGNNISDEYIGRVRLGTIDNSSNASSGYTDYTSISTGLAKGDTYTITINPTWTGTIYSEGYSVWIDYNKDGDFTDSGEQVWSQSATTSTPVSGSFTVPTGASDGSTRMRVSLKYNGVPSSCETFSYGEVEDYTVILSASTADTTPPSAPTNLTSSNVTQTTIDLSWLASTDNVGVVEYSVYQNGTVLGTVTGTGGQITGLDSGTNYQYYVTASDAAGNESSASNTISVTTQSGGSGGGGSEVLHQGSFESGWDGWSDGGGDCYRYSGSSSYEGNYSIRLRDNSGTRSAMTLGSFDVSSFNNIDINFFFYANSMENGEDFWVRFYDGSSWNTVASYARGTSFDNNTFYEVSINISSSDYNFPSNAQFRIQCDASANGDQVYIDQVTITGNTSNTNAIASTEGIRFIAADTNGFIGGDTEGLEAFSIYPNPTKSVLNVALDGDASATYQIVNMLGQVVKYGDIQQQINVSNLKPGVYFMQIDDGEEVNTQRFVKE